MSDGVAPWYGRSFDLLDTDRNGVIEANDLAALANGLLHAGDIPVDSAKGQALRAAYQRFWEIISEYADADSDRRITREEFINAMDGGMSRGSMFTEGVTDAVAAEFAVVDANDDGQVDLAELQRFLQSAGLPEDEARQTAADIDLNGDGIVSLEEYEQAWRRYYLGGDPQTQS
ncbi:MULTISPECIES: EF-hand domain-containing protein [Actinomadura]|nr:EF-hand domain-containing protein [Actinomadura rudentiformis]